MDLGQMRRGVDMGPSAVRYAGLQERLRRLGYDVIDDGNIDVVQLEEIRQASKMDGGESAASLRALSEIADACQQTYQTAKTYMAKNARAIFLGGDHSISIGTVAGVTTNHPVGVIWVDAHGDINTPETTPSGNIHGMSVATLLGYGDPSLVNIGREGAKITPEQIVMIGVRDLDPGERVLLRKTGVTVFTMRQIDEMGMATVLKKTLDQMAPYDRLHVSLDLDGLDPEVAPGVGTPVAGGLTYREAHLIMEILADSTKVRSMDIVEINPILDNANITGRIAVEFASSLFGQRIL